MKPCNQCKNKNGCTIFAFVNRNKSKSPWELDTLLRNYTPVAQVESADGTHIILECADFTPNKKQEDYSNLVNDPRRYADDDCCARRQVKQKLGGSGKNGCGGCGGNCP